MATKSAEMSQRRDKESIDVTGKENAADGQAPYEPINVVNAGLEAALATLDLLYTLVSTSNCAGFHIEELADDTLSTVVSGVIGNLEKAHAAATDLHNRMWALKKANEARQAQP